MPALIDITVPESSQEGTESFVAGWLKKTGDPVALHEPLLEISTDKVNMEVASPAEGILTEILKKENEKIEPGDVLGRIQLSVLDSTPASTEKTEPSAAEPKSPSPAVEDRELGLSPSVRRLIKKHDMDISQLAGSGRGGRITYQDVEAYLESQAETAKEPEPIELTAKKIPHSPMRLSIADHMVRSMLKTAPHVTAVFDADMSAVIAHRVRNRDEFQQRGAKLTYTAYFVIAAVKALQAVPEANSRWHDDSLELLEDCNIGMATALESGLIVPVIHKAQDLDLRGIAEKLEDLTSRARNNKLEQHEVQNGTFTITNHGVSGSLIATPIINQPQSAILGVGKLDKRVVAVEVNGTDSIQVKPMIYVTLTIDHRVLDGFQANTFLSRFVEVLENWG
jgi:2-oxoglutarate dehydrogenase E2 component (dihydrolipoamide succinyltransferase)